MVSDITRNNNSTMPPGPPVLHNSPSTPPSDYDESENSIPSNAKSVNQCLKQDISEDVPIKEYDLPDHLGDLIQLTTSKDHTTVAKSFVDVLNVLCGRDEHPFVFMSKGSSPMPPLGDEGHADMPDIWCMAKEHETKNA